MTSPPRWPIAKEGLSFLIPFALFAVVAAVMGWNLLTFFAILFTLFIGFFFRNPQRKVPSDENVIISPADGKIIFVGEQEEDRFLKRKALKISIFMSIFDVHINRSPVSGKVLERSYFPGRFLLASRERSSLLNEQNALVLDSEDWSKIVLVQVAGFIARRIVCYANVDDVLTRGQIFGMIRFGSRVDLYLPLGVKPLVSVGQHVKGGESIIGCRE